QGRHQWNVARAQLADSDVVFLGDSITYWWGDVGRDALGYNVWSQQIAPLNPANFGIPGDRTQNLLWQVENGELVGQPKVAVILIGTNNLADGQTPEQTADGIAMVVQAVRTQSPQTKILLLGILPRGGSPSDPA